MRKFIVITLLIGVVGYVTVVLAQMTQRIQIGMELTNSAVAYSRVKPDSSVRMLVLGDSTALGVGVSGSKYSIAGRFGEEFPEMAIGNISESGMRLADLAEQIVLLDMGRHYEVLLIQIGGNDILRFTNRKDLRQDLREILQFSETVADSVFILHSGNMGLAPFFPWPAGPVLTDRTRVVRQIFLEEARQYAGVYYVDLFTEVEEDPFAEDYEKYYAEDLLHLSDEGYGVWYKKIRETMDNAGFTP